MPLPPLVEPAADLSVDEVRRYSRHLIIPDVAMAGQKRLKAAQVLCVGAGGLGSPALMYLAAAGVGTLGIIDYDTVDESNLQRQIIHGQSDVGRSKAESARDSVREINPLIEVVLHTERLDSSQRHGDLRPVRPDRGRHGQLRHPLPGQRRLRAAGQALRVGLDLPLRRAGDRVLGRARPVLPVPVPGAPAARHGPSCAEGGVLGVLCASIGSIQVTEAIKLITGIGEPLLGRLMIYDALDMNYRTVKVRKDPNCAVCGENPTVTELIDYEAFCGAVSEEASEAVKGSTISVTELADMLEERESGDRDFLLIDVREPAEWEIVSIPGAQLIPKGEFLSGAALADLPQHKPIVVHCKAGVRSAEVLAVLKDAGFADAVHVGGGIVAWVNQIEPDKPSY